MIRRTTALIMTMLLATAGFTAPALASPGDEAGFVALINSERSNRGLRTLDVYWDLVDDARVHADVMANADQIFHSSNLAKVATGWAALGENVGVGPTVAELHAAFMDSAGHRDNILGDWDSIGVGVTPTDKGYMFVTVVFMKSAATEPEPAPEPSPAPEPEPAPEPAPAAADVQAVQAVAAVPAAAPAPAPVAVPHPDPEPICRLIDELLAGAEFPFCLV